MNLILSTNRKMASKFKIGLPLLAIVFCGSLPPIFAAENTVPGNFPPAKVAIPESTSIGKSSNSLNDSLKRENNVEQGAVPVLKPGGGMPQWYYRCERNFRYPIPTDFEYAYIDRTGRIAITGPFNVAHSFSHGVARVMLGCYGIENGRIVYKIDGDRNGVNALLFPDGSLKSNICGEFQGDFLDELAVSAVSSETEKNGKKQWLGIHPALVNKNGEVVLAKGWEEAGPYSDGLVAVLKQGMRKLPGGSSEELVEQCVPLWGYCDRSGADIIAPQFDVAEPFSEGLAAVSLHGSSIEQWSDPNSFYYIHPFTFFYINKLGQVAIPGPFSEARPFVNGLAAVMINDKWGYIDALGKLVVPCRYDWAGDFRGKLAPVEKNQLVGYIDATGGEVIPFKFKDGREFVSGLAPATSDGRHWGYINEAGSYAIAPIFQKAFPFESDRALVYIDRRKDIKPEAREAEHLYNSSQSVRQLGLVNDARAMCLAVLDVAPASQWARKAKRLLETSLPDHYISEEAVNLYGRGSLWSQRGNLKAGEDCFLQALALEPDYFLAAAALANNYIQQQRYDEAQNLLEKTLKRHPSYARGHWRLSRVYECRGQNALAKAALARARELDPDDPIFVN